MQGWEIVKREVSRRLIHKKSLSSEWLSSLIRSHADWWRQIFQTRRYEKSRNCWLAFMELITWIQEQRFVGISDKRFHNFASGKTASCESDLLDHLEEFQDSLRQAAVTGMSRGRAWPMQHIKCLFQTQRPSRRLSQIQTSRHIAFKPRQKRSKNVFDIASHTHPIRLDHCGNYLHWLLQLASRIVLHNANAEGNKFFSIVRA
jgi:hypothetical protein